MDYKFVSTFKMNFDFGMLLSVDFSSCCETADLFNLTEEIFHEIKDCVKNKGIPDLVWFKGMGESIKYANCKEIVDLIKVTYPNQKIGVYLNCSLFKDKDIRKDFYDCDLVAINLNSIEESNFSKYNKCPKSVNSFEVLEGIREFRKEFTGNLGIYTLFLRGLNDTPENVWELKNFLLEVNPDHYSVSNYTLDGFRPLSDKFKDFLREALKDLPFKVMYMI